MNNHTHDVPDDVQEILRVQDEIMALLERLRAEEPVGPEGRDHSGGGRRDFRRWPTPPGVSLDVHDGLRWHAILCMDMGVGGARVEDLPAWVSGPVPARLGAPIVGAILVLADVVWRDKKERKTGLRFQFRDESERELWYKALIDALLAGYALD